MKQKTLKHYLNTIVYIHIATCPELSQLGFLAFFCLNAGPWEAIGCP